MPGSKRVEKENLWRILKKTIIQNTGKSGIFPTRIPELCYHCHEEPEMPIRHFMQPVLIIVVQGAKFVQVGNDRRSYSAGMFFLSAVDMPVTSCVLEASRTHPYLSLSISLDINIIASFAVQARFMPRSENGAVTGATGHEADAELLDAVARLAELSRDPVDVACLKSGIIGEIHYRLLKGGAGEILYSLCSLNAPLSRIRDIIMWIRENYRKRFTISDLSRYFSLAPSTLHKYFKQVTSLSPIQYQ
ncbi:MAG: AraC family transcriptional regulator [Desulfovibrio sp.]|nr:AraC family transcriptional regulator [Desulfovibrio sp.]